MKEFYTPIAIVIAGACIALALFYGGTAEAPDTRYADTQGAPTPSAKETPEPPQLPDEPVTRETNNHIYGNPDAPTTIVEFSDFECPFCNRVHTTLKRIVDESGGTINWEYRHLPLSMHRNAQPAAVASECVKQFAGNDGFWRYADTLVTNHNRITPTFLKTEAEKIGLDAATYDTCIADPQMAAIVADDAGTAVAFGGSGTPYSIIVYADGSKEAINGALPYEMWLPYLPKN
ncbi:MAG: DsbA family protein [Candidatus Pacebacteria bacterium]|nr:DsbA family protein [Candidatus Paceibacterota bacterium]